jgi:hypothetical protein
MNIDDYQAITQVVQNYYDGMVHGRDDLLQGVFAADAQFQGIRDGTKVQRGLDEFINMVRNPDPWMKKDYGMQIEMIDQSGPIGIVKVVDRFRGRSYTDYLSLLKGDEGWRIVNKTFWAWPQVGTEGRSD